MKKALIIFFISILLVIVVLLTLEKFGKSNQEYFIKYKIESRIIKIHDEQGKFYRYYYDSTHYINSYTINDDKLFINDSISKKSNTKFFSVYRKNSNGDYVLYKSFNLEYPFSF